MKVEFNDVKRVFEEIYPDIFATPSPSGYYREIIPVIRELAEKCGCTFEMTAKGCALLTYPGKDHSKAYGACAHVDTLGAMVRSVSANGDIMFTKVGSPVMATLDGEYCTVIARDGRKYSGTILSKSPAIHVYKDASTKERSDSEMYVRLDEDVKSEDDVRALGIENGCYICIDPKTQLCDSGYFKSRFIDDKCGVTALLSACRLMKENGAVPQYDIKILFTVYEEVGHGASWVPDDLIFMLGVDMGCIGEDLSCTEHDVSICAKDSHGPYDYELTSYLITLAKENSLSYAVDIYPFYGSDVEAMFSAGYDIPGALIGTGVHASHGMERTHLDGIFNTVSLILLYFGV